MHSQAVVAEALALRREGLGARRIASRMDLPLGTVKDWLSGRLPNHSLDRDPALPVPTWCPQCGHNDHRLEELPSDYVYLLGLYLGDGCISEHRRRVFRLRIFLDLRDPLIIEDCVASVRAVAPNNAVHQLKRHSNYIEREEPSNVQVSSFSKIWPCLFPQHGPGRKHARSITLTEWQLDLVARWPEQLLRGLIHSDGCRFINTGRQWTWPRYSFSNKSDDIRAIFSHACELMDVHWTASGDHTIYVSRKADVATLDRFIGPKR